MSVSCLLSEYEGMSKTCDSVCLLTRHELRVRMGLPPHFPLLNVKPMDWPPLTSAESNF